MFLLYIFRSQCNLSEHLSSQQLCDGGVSCQEATLDVHAQADGSPDIQTEVQGGGGRLYGGRQLTNVMFVCKLQVCCIFSVLLIQI